MLREIVRDVFIRSLAALREHGELPDVEIPEFEVERPQIAAHGDYGTNVAMKMAAAVRSSGGKSNPRALAELIAGHVREVVEVVPAYHFIQAVEVAGPGFINIRLRPEWLFDQARNILESRDTFGEISIGRGKRINSSL